MPPATQAAIARAFAPTLVFHRLEKYFPVSSIPVDMDTPSARTGDMAALRLELGTPALRLANYVALSLDEKIRAATLRYRVFTRTQRGRAEVVVEYWCYYVYNEFTVRGAWFPYRVSDNHPNDLERIYIVLTALDSESSSPDIIDEAWARRAFRIRRVIANAHDGNIPPNTYTVPDGQTLALPLVVLVERGSHAMAPDINDDGRWTPDVDSTRVKFLWGIRDHGATWRRYSPSYMDDREGSVRLCGSLFASQAEPCRPYALYPGDDLAEWVEGLRLSRQEWREIIGRTPRLLGTFGDVHVEKLMVPTDPPGPMLDAMLRRRLRSERGLLMAFTTVGHFTPAFVVGGRYFWEMPPSYAPDVIAEAVGIFPVGGRRAAEVTLLGSYSIDAITRVLAGAGWVSSHGVTPDLVGGLDLRVGRLRVRPTWRFFHRTFDSRVAVVF